MTNSHGTTQIGFRVDREDGARTYVLTYNGLAPEPTPRAFDLPTGESVPVSEQHLKFPNGDTMPIDEAVFEQDVDELRIRRDRSIGGKLSRAVRRRVTRLLQQTPDRRSLL